MCEAEQGLEELPERGVYTLIIELHGPLELEVGSLGRIRLEPGFYLYTGSALGRGPLGLRGRVKRHLSKAKKIFWHIDYVLVEPGARVVAVVAAGTGERLECVVNKALAARLGAGAPVRGFGSSDCRSGCQAHLLYTGQEEPTEHVRAVYASLGLRPVVLRLTGRWGCL